MNKNPQFNPHRAGECNCLAVVFAWRRGELDREEAKDLMEQCGNRLIVSLLNSGFKTSYTFT